MTLENKFPNNALATISHRSFSEFKTVKHHQKLGFNLLYADSC